MVSVDVITAVFVVGIVLIVCDSLHFLVHFPELELLLLCQRQAEVVAEKVFVQIFLVFCFFSRLLAPFIQESIRVLFADLFFRGRCLGKVFLAGLLLGASFVVHVRHFTALCSQLFLGVLLSCLRAIEKLQVLVLK